MAQDIASIDAIFYEALMLPAGEKRQAYLREACGDGTSLRARIDGLLLAYSKSGSFLETPALPEPVTTQPFLAERPGTKIGPYTLVEKIGEGGMGIVFLAEQHHPMRRQVALKIIRPGMDTREVVARFEAERQALALMDHPNIAKVYDAGTTETGRPYFVMGLVRGIPVTDYCEQAGLALHERLTLFMTVCNAVQHAHLRGIIHRDLKPTNVLVTVDDGLPIPVVIDFGVAKALSQRLTEQTLFTRNQQLIGTPLYMSPEQAEQSGLNIDTRTDVYSLGVILYELLTGTTPFDRKTITEKGLDEYRRVLREEDPPRPSVRLSRLDVGSQTAPVLHSGLDARQLSRSLRGELDWIVMKTLEKDRNRRYLSPSDLAEDIQRFLNHEPVTARPPSALYLARKLARRRRGLVVTVIVLVVTALIAAGLLWSERSRTLAALARESQQRHAAEEQEQMARASEAEALAQRNLAIQNQYYAEIVSGQSDWEQGYLERLNQKLTRYLPVAEQPDRRGWEWYYLFSLCHPESRTLCFPHRIPFVTWSPDGELIAASGGIWKPDTGENLHRMLPSMNLRCSSAWSPDGQMLSWGTVSNDNCVYVWDRRADEIRELRGHRDSVWCVAWSRDGKQLASGGMDNEVWIWDVASGAHLKTFGADHDITDVAWSPDGDLFAAGVRNNRIQIWRPETGEFVREESLGDASELWHVRLSWHPSGACLAVSTQRNWHLLNRLDGTIRRQQKFDRGLGADIAWSPHGERLAVADGEVISIWDPVAPEPERILRGHLRPINAIAWSPDGQQLVSSDNVEDIKIWDLNVPLQPPVISTRGPLESLSWRSDNESLQVVSAVDDSLSVWDVSHAQQSNLTPAPKLAEEQSVWSPDGRFTAVYPDTGPAEVRIFDARSLAVHATYRNGSDEQVRWVAWSADESMLAIAKTGPQSSTVELWDVDHERRIAAWPYQSMWITNRGAVQWEVPGEIAWSPDGTQIAVGARGELGDNGSFFWQGHIYVVDVRSGDQILKHNVGGWEVSGLISALAWNPQGGQVVAGTEDGMIEAVAVDSGQVVFSTPLHSTKIHSLAWSQDGQRIAASAQDGSVRILSAVDGRELLLFAMESEPQHVAWSLDNRRLAAATADGKVQIWDASRAHDLSSGGPRRGELAWAYFRAARKQASEVNQDRLRAVLTLAPDTLEFWGMRGQVRAELGDFPGAVAEFAKAVSPGLRRSLLPALDYGHALLGAGRKADFRQLCLSLDVAFKDTQIPSIRAALNRLHVLAPQPPSDRYEEVPALEALKSADKILVSGARLFRNGKFDEAVEFLGDAVTRLERASEITKRGDLACTYYFLAMTRHRLGHEFQAKRHLEEASRVADELVRHGGSWQDKVRVNVLDQEARALISE